MPNLGKVGRMRGILVGVVGLLACASAADARPAKQVMREWMVANERCVGGHVTAASQICRKRDRLQDEARKLGWCWSYSDDRVFPYDYRWHHCSEPRPKNFKPDF